MKIAARVFLLFLLLPASTLADEWVYTVRAGDNPWNITERFLKSIGYWKPLVRFNQITQPKRIPPGTKLRIPLRWSKIKTVAARIVAIHGEAKVVRGQATGTPASPGMRLDENDRLVTSPKSNVLVEFADGTRLLLSAESILNLKNLKGYGRGDVTDTRLQMEGGRSESLVNPRKRAGTRFEISTPSAIAAVRGTGFRIQSTENGKKSRVEVTDGRVAVTGASKSRTLKRGFGLVVNQGESLKKPVRLLPPPAIDVVPEKLEATLLAFKLKPSAKAVGYRVQIVNSKQLGTMVLDEQFKGNNIRMDVTNLLDDNYSLKIRAIDKKGLEGLESRKPFELNARPAAPFLSAPAAETKLVETRPKFNWARPEEAESYHFQLARNEQMDDPVLDQAGLTQEELTPSTDLPLGQYFWRVTAHDGAGKAGPAGFLQSFRIVPKAPDAAPPVVDETGLLFQWRPGTTGQRYGFQLAWDETFDDLVVETELSEPSYQLATPKPGIYFSRVRTIDEDGFAGPFGPYQRIEIKGPPPDLNWVVITPFLGLLLLL
ncbi:MAG: LysM peptidoglycan-binding domain-containing protein [Gammaproteobacteria bacterium]|nr:LysM peptidoglycan-binding domain-containing protein [Gammaproteobacteria bacterium]